MLLTFALLVGVWFLGSLGLSFAVLAVASRKGSARPARPIVLPGCMGV